MVYTFENQKAPVVESCFNWQRIRQAALAKFRAYGFPNKREESWRYTSLAELTDRLIKPCDPFFHNSTAAGDCVVDSVLEPSCTLSTLRLCAPKSSNPSLPAASYEKGLLSKSLGESQGVKSKEPTHPDVNETEAQRLTTQEEFERRRVYVDDARYLLVVVNGYVDLAKSRLPECVRVVKLAAVDADEHARGMLTTLMVYRPEDQPGHVAVNLAHAVDGVFVHIMKGQRLDRPLEVQYITTSQAEGSSYSQVWWVMEADSQATLIERFIGNNRSKSDKIRHCHNHVAHILLRDGANLEHYRLQDLPIDCYHLYTAQLQCEHNSHYQAFSAYTGAGLSRQEVNASLNGENVKCDQRGITIGSANQHHDIYLPVFHNKPNSYSNQHFRQLLDDNSKGIFYGSVHVAEHSFKTKAHQLNRNLLLSSGAKAVARPELKIFNDDIVCSHGATTGNLDQEVIYYLQTRGLTVLEAKILLTEAFLSELLGQVKNEYVRETATAQVKLALSVKRK